MFAIVDKETMRVVGTTHVAEPSDTQHFVPVTKEQYIRFNEDPVFMSSQGAIQQEDGVVVLNTDAT